MTTLCMRSAMACLLAFGMAACATPNTGPTTDTKHQVHHPEQQGQVAPPGTSAREAPPMEGMRSMDMQAMCDMHKRMMSATSPAERDAMMDEHMKSMPPDKQRKHLEQMTKTCQSY